MTDDTRTPATDGDRYEGLALDPQEKAEAKRLGVSEDAYLAHKYVGLAEKAVGAGWTVREYQDAMRLADENRRQGRGTTLAQWQKVAPKR